MFDFTAYVIFPDQQFVIYLHRWFAVSQWYIIYPLAMLHSAIWVVIKVGIIHLATVIVHWKKAHHSKRSHLVPEAESRSVFHWLGQKVKYSAHKMYEGAKHLAHGKPVTPPALFWLTAMPLMQKVGEAIVGIAWSRFGWRGMAALVLGACFQVDVFCALYSIFGKQQAEQLMYWIMLPLGAIILIAWLRKNGRRTA